MGPDLQHHPLSARALEGPDARARAEAQVGLYVHVPFCAVLCNYCDFSSGTLSSRAVERYLAALEREAALRAPSAAGVAFTSLFFGGGTPSALAPRVFRHVMRLVRDHFAIAPDAEVTLEANPEGVKPGLLDAWRAEGVNRLSMGAQSFEPDELAMLGRIHNDTRPAEAFALAREHGFGRLSLDLMFAYPGHDAERWGRTLNRALALEPEHLSAYCFIPEAETPMGRAVLRGEQALPPHDAQADLYAQLEERVARAGYGCYETSNFARPAAEARHNLVYWLRRDYLGLGPSAHALWRGVREGNAYALDTWASRLERDEPCGEIEPETEVSRADEIVMLGLRLATGLVRADYADAVWRSVARRYAAAFRAGAATGRIEATADGCRIAARHRFVADDVIAWLMAAAERHDPAAVVDSSESVSVPSAPCLIHHSPAA